MTADLWATQSLTAVPDSVEEPLSRESERTVPMELRSRPSCLL